MDSVRALRPAPARVGSAFLSLAFALGCAGAPPTADELATPASETAASAPGRAVEESPPPDPPSEVEVTPDPPAPSRPRVSDDPSEVLDEATRRIAEAIPDEGTPNPGEHYPVSNEWRHDLFESALSGLGGAFVGVGADQCYTLAAMQGASILWAVDFDPLVPEIHRLYGLLLEEAESPEALLELFSDAEAARVEARLSESDPGLSSIYRRQRARMLPYLRRVSRGRGTWLADPARFAHIRALHRAGRVIARNGDVTADGALRAVGRAARELEVPVRVLYFSNADQFFPYNDGLRANVEALPTDGQSLVLRTFRDRRATYPEGDRWHYVIQPMSDFRARVLEGGYRRSQQLVLDLLSSRRLGAEGVSTLDERVPIRSR